MAVNIKEKISEKISNLMITNYSKLGVSSLESQQRTVKNGIITAGRVSGDKMYIYQSDYQAYPEDKALVNQIYHQIIGEYGSYNDNSLDSSVDYNTIVRDFINAFTFKTMTVPDSDTGEPITRYFIKTNLPIDGDSGHGIEIYSFTGESNPQNIGQFIDFVQTRDLIDPKQAVKWLDTKVYELLPSGTERQDRIDRFFQEWAQLKGDLPPFIDSDGDGEDDSFSNQQEHAQYSGSHDISAQQDANIDDSEGYITRLDRTANTKNVGKTMQTLRDELNEYLKDLDEQITEIDDERPEYTNKSDGYLKLRHLNQGIIIRKQEGDNVGIEEMVSNPEVHGGKIGPSYLVDGFTISMWVKFLDKVNKGTLFNYGNPTRTIDPKGFKLETFIIEKDELMTNSNNTWGEYVIINGINDKMEQEGQKPFFQDSEQERFIRLVVYDHMEFENKKLYDSHLGIPGIPRSLHIPEFGYHNTETFDYHKGYEGDIFSHTRVPIDFDEWFFIVASYNPITNENSLAGFEENSDYWSGNIEFTTPPDPENPTYTANSGYGVKCKVEIISKSDLLRARGYKVE
tara:strand:+ start:3205 stop:4911 length:1707 start_codon:yes stop_codon:yes gene_type:complete